MAQVIGEVSCSGVSDGIDSRRGSKPKQNYSSSLDHCVLLGPALRQSPARPVLFVRVPGIQAALQSGSGSRALADGPSGPNLTLSCGPYVEDRN